MIDIASAHLRIRDNVDHREFQSFLLSLLVFLLSQMTVPTAAPGHRKPSVAGLEGMSSSPTATPSFGAK